MPVIDIIAGARPNFMKIAPILRAIEHDDSGPEKITYRLIHTGQHYDKKMSGNFFDELGIPSPDINLGAGGGTQAEQAGKIMIGYEKLLLEDKSDLCLVVGDVTSTMACAISAQKLGVPVAHVEAGIRSGDWSMPEEINRMVTDSITNYFFTTSEHANSNLRKSGIEEDRIFFVGNTMIDTLMANLPRLQRPAIWDSESLVDGQYLVLTMHRPNNVDEGSKLRDFINAILDASVDYKIVFPVHPRTSKMLKELGIDHPRLIAIEPLGYLAFVYLIKHCKAVLTDSGGITEEATVLGVPCLTLRDNTERPETVEVGTNELIGTSAANIGPALQRVFDGEWKKGGIPEKWDGRTAERIVDALSGIFSQP